MKIKIYNFHKTRSKIQTSYVLIKNRIAKIVLTLNVKKIVMFYEEKN